MKSRNTNVSNMISQNIGLEFNFMKLKYHFFFFCKTQISSYLLQKVNFSKYIFNINSKKKKVENP